MLQSLVLACQTPAWALAVALASKRRQQQVAQEATGFDQQHRAANSLCQSNASTLIVMYLLYCQASGFDLPLLF